MLAGITLMVMVLVSSFAVSPNMPTLDTRDAVGMKSYASKYLCIYCAICADLHLIGPTDSSDGTHAYSS